MPVPKQDCAMEFQMPQRTAFGSHNGVTIPSLVNLNMKIAENSEIPAI